MLISYIKLDHMLYLINYSNREEMETGRERGAGQLEGDRRERVIISIILKVTG